MARASTPSVVEHPSIVPVILSGGAGVRLWPLSRELQPKPFMRMADGESLLRKTYARVMSLDGVETIVTITNREHFFQSKAEFDAARGRNAAVHAEFILEPVGRNTAPAIAIAALSIAERFGPDTIMLVLPADHLVEDVAGFAVAACRARDAAALGLIATFGIVPHEAQTAFGYIECGEALADQTTRKVAAFVEKPDIERARRFVEGGNHLWNAGMFCLTAATALRELEAHAAALLEAVRQCWAASRASCRHGCIQLDTATFEKVPAVSIDYAVMENSQSAVVVPGQFGWSDIGSWSAVSKLGTPDADGNRVTGEAVLVNVSDTMVSSDSRLVAAVGVTNLVIVDTPDALLVADRGKAQEVREVVAELKRRNHESYRLHRTVARPWGTYTILEEGPRFKIKRIVVKPGASLSLQKHHHRSEHWVVIAGAALVVNGDTEKLVRVDESTYIPAGTPHRLSNPGKIDCVMIEVQSGDYVGEDDIVRLEDSYGRIEPAASHE